VVVVEDRKHASTKMLPSRWTHQDEWYNFQSVPKNVRVLLLVDESTYKGGKHVDYHPIAWYHKFDGGRSFYTALGHFDHAYKDPKFVAHLLAGINYAMGVKSKK
jgi:type 1 glutamine amidotransferase